MSHKHVAECMDRTLRDLCSCDLPFGGKVMVFGGDFRQILPVIRRGTRGDVVSACLNRSSLWRYVKVLNLTINMRLRIISSQDSLEVSEFSNFLLRVGEGTELEDEDHMIHIDDKFIVPGNDISDLVSSVYGDIVNNYLDQDFMSRRILMSPKNETVDAINDYVMRQIPGDDQIFLSADSVDDAQAAIYPTEFLNSRNPNDMPPHRLKLKEFASIILLRNLDSAQGLCNGTRLTVRSFTKRLIDAEIATGIHAGTRVFIPRIALLTPSDSGLPFILKRRQFPGRPAFCITINKGQGQSLETVGIFLPSPEAIFSHGQLYVALSRVQNPSGLKIMVCGGQQCTGGGVLVKNVVYREVFLTRVGEPSSSSQDLIDSFSLDDISFDSSQLSPVLSHAKKRVIMADSERKSKVSKIFEFSQSSVVTLEDPENNAFQSNRVTFESSDVVFNAIIRHPSMTGLRKSLSLITLLSQCDIIWPNQSGWRMKRFYRIEKI